MLTHRYRLIFLIGLVMAGLQSCVVSNKSWSPSTPYAKEQLQKDYRLFRNILEESHPSLYWYTPKDSMDYYFDWGYRQLNDSMTEPQFRSILSYVIAKIKCGHTSTRYSRKFLHFLDTARLPQFPISIKVLEQDTVVLNNYIQHSTLKLPRGTILTSLNGAPIKRIVDSLVLHIPQDGNNENYLMQTISNRGAFGGWMRLVAGYVPAYQLGYLDSLGQEQQTVFNLVDPPKKDSSRKPILPEIRRQLKRREQKANELDRARSLQIDTGLSTGYMTVNTFNNGYQLKSFFRSAFKDLRRFNIQHLVIDIRSNGGGNVAHSTLLTKKIRHTPFKLADSLYAVNRKSRYGNYVRYNRVTGIFMRFISKKKSDGFYHFGYFERKQFKPALRDRYKGKVYVLTGPNSFSAASIFALTVKGQSNVTLIGEETGGAAYGNSAWFIPDVRLPETGIRFRLPKFRLVINKNAVKDGRGVLPDIEVKATRQSVIENRDLKVEAVRQLIIQKR
jgi:hypothetical protein